jgi:DNA-binding NtrC family response regulator
MANRSQAKDLSACLISDKVRSLLTVKDDIDQMRKKTIVIIDDDAVDVVDIERKIAANVGMVNLKNIKIEIFNSADAGLEWLFSNEADLLILDVCLPEVDATGVMKALNKNHVILPICLISGVNEMLYIAEQVGIGQESVIVAQFKKPIPTEEFGKLLKDLAIV